MASRQPTQGYSALAELFACYPSLGAFRLFKDLTAANLLDLQAEILLLNRDLEVFTHDESKLSICTEAEPLTAPVQHLKKSNPQSCPYHERIWRTKLEIREKLKEYNEAHLHFEHLTTHPKPDKRELKALRKWLGSQGRGHGHGFLEGVEYLTWSEDTEDDLACFSRYSTDTDLLSRWLEGPLLDWWHDTLGKAMLDPLSTAERPPPKDLLGPLCYYSDSHVSRIIHTVSTVFASLLPTVPLFVLYYIDSQVARMGAILVMTLIFSTLLTILTNAKRSEVFAAAVAFTAIQVVFLSNNNTN